MILLVKNKNLSEYNVHCSIDGFSFLLEKEKYYKCETTKVKITALFQLKKKKSIIKEIIIFLLTSIYVYFNPNDLDIFDDFDYIGDFTINEIPEQDIVKLEFYWNYDENCINIRQIKGNDVYIESSIKKIRNEEIFKSNSRKLKIYLTLTSIFLLLIPISFLIIAVAHRIQEMIIASCAILFALITIEIIMFIIRKRKQK